MIQAIIDANGKSELHIDGSYETCLQEISIALLEICEALSNSTGVTFDDTFGTVVQNSKLLKFFKDKERDYENRT